MDTHLGEQNGRDDGAEHVTGTVREVDHTEHAEDDSEAEGGQGVEAPCRQALQGVLDESAHVTVRSVPGRPPAGAGGGAAG
jgi:hypothetical protein